MSHDIMLTSLRRLGLSPDDAAAMRAAASPERALPKAACLTDEGEPTEALTILCSGVAQAYRTVRRGGRQTLALFVPGDIVDIQGFILGRSHVSIGAVTPISVSQIPRARLERLINDQPAVGRALWQAMAWDNTVLQEWLVGSGRRTSYAQMAHLICEISTRLKATGAARGNRCPFPLTQSDMADILGLSTVHVNRVLQQLRAAGLINLRGGQLEVPDPALLTEAAEFNPSYLGVRGQEIA
jgi:CRP-like cAMP-binding protein